jgi:four helix bundle suffix protein
VVSEGFIPPHGGYVNLASYRKAVIIFDGTVRFCERFLERGDRTWDQMVQAARSGKQNIVEGSMAAGTSRGTEIKLTNVARASLEELLEDYRDFLRVRGLALWANEDARAEKVRSLAMGRDVTYGTYAAFVERASAEIAANTMICLIHQANYLLDRQIRQQEAAFLKEGGIRERMFEARQRARKYQPEDDDP